MRLALRCDRCVENTVQTLSGAAQSRGEAWASRVARRRPELLRAPWPDTSKARTIAPSQVADITSGEQRLVEAFVVFVQAGAIRRWNQLRSMSDDERRNALAMGEDQRRRKR
jgi:hypothetical protein